MLFLHTTSPFEAKDRGAEIENGPTGQKASSGQEGSREEAPGEASASSLRPSGASRSVDRPARGRASLMRCEEKRFGR